MARLDNSPARGTRDMLPALVTRREQVIASIAETYGRFGFRRIETPSIESVERLTGGQGGENEKLIFKILRRGLTDPPVGSLSELTDLGLRFDLTVPLTRFYANNQAQLPLPFRALQIGNVWRAERPAKGRYRQFTQCDIDVLGEPSVLAECELLEATTEALLRLGIGPVTVRLNDRRLLGAMATEAGVDPSAVGGVFVSLDKLDKIGWEGVSSELASRDVGEVVIGRLRHFVESLSGAGDAEELVKRAADSLPSLAHHVLDDLVESVRALESIGAADSRVRCVLDPTVVRGMGYYTGQIFEVAHAGSDSSIAGGGRYDGLVGRSLGRDVPACGISIGFDRIVDLAVVEPADLGVAVLYGSEGPEQVLGAARQLRQSGSAAALVKRRKQLHAQLDALRDEGYSGFVLFEDGVASAVRQFAPPGDER